ALGLTFGTNPDGTITVGTSFDTTIAVWQHEINEILGGGGIGSRLGNPLAQAFGATDLYRYSGLHTPSYTRDTSATGCLSVDGGATCIALRASIKAASAISEISSRPPGPVRVPIMGNLRSSLRSFSSAPLRQPQP